jgi:hypothetical protein
VLEHITVWRRYILNECYAVLSKRFYSLICMQAHIAMDANTPRNRHKLEHTCTQIQRSLMKDGEQCGTETLKWAAWWGTGFSCASSVEDWEHCCWSVSQSVFPVPWSWCRKEHRNVSGMSSTCKWNCFSWPGAREKCASFWVRRSCVVVLWLQQPSPSTSKHSYHAVPCNSGISELLQEKLVKHLARLCYQWVGT